MHFLSSLYISVTFANFQSLGKILVLIERLKRLVRNGAIIVSASFKSLAETLSRLQAFFLGRAEQVKNLTNGRFLYTEGVLNSLVSTFMPVAENCI